MPATDGDSACGAVVQASFFAMFFPCISGVFNRLYNILAISTKPGALKLWNSSAHKMLHEFGCPLRQSKSTVKALSELCFMLCLGKC